MTRFTLTVLFMIAVVIPTAFGHGDETGAVPLPDERYIPGKGDLHRGMAMAKTNGAFLKFSREHPAWQFRPDPLTGTLHRAWGDGIRIQGFAHVNLLSAPAAGRRFIQDHADVLRVRPDELSLLYSEIAGGKVYQKYIQTHEGIEVLHSEVDLRITLDGRVFMFGSDFHQNPSVNTVPSLGLEAARALSNAGLTEPVPDENISDGKIFILPLRYPSRTDYRLVYRFIAQESESVVWETYVDAHAGNVVWRRNLVMNAHSNDKLPVRGTMNTVTGRITVTISMDSWSKGTDTYPMPYANINVGGKELITDADGRFTTDISSATAPVVTRLAGPFAIARRADSTASIRNGRITTTAIAGQELEIHWDNSNSVASERNVFYHMTAVRTFLRSIDQSDVLAALDKQMTGVVNINNSCNAFWDPAKQTVNFYKESAQCGNTGEIADVIIHEMGHGVNQFIYVKLRRSNMRNGALSEATADILANMMRDDPRIGIGFRKNQPNDGTIRNSDNDRVYPKDLVFQIHDDGMILTGAVWDMRKAIGLETSRRLTHFAKYGTPDGTTTGEAFADYFIEILVADDDDGNLANGTPNSHLIIPAFVRHGIPASGMSIYHDITRDQNSVTVPYPVNGLALVGASINRNYLYIKEVKIVYTTDDWQTQSSVQMSVNLSTQAITGHFPPQRAGSIVRYYFEAADNFGATFREPLEAPRKDFAFLVGFDTKYRYDCEEQDGWTVFSECVTGKWVRVKPIGTYNTELGAPPDVPWVQPNEDHTIGIGKDRCWVTGNAPAEMGLGEQDVDEGYTNLKTRVVDVSSMLDPVLRYYRWYSNDAGANPGIAAWVVRVSSDGGSTWKEIENTHEADASWQPRIFRIKDLVDLTPNFLVEFSASDSVLDKQSLVEAAVDDYEILDINPALVGVTAQAAVPYELTLEQNFPNPFNPSTTINFSLPAAEMVTLRVFSSLGVPVGTPAEGYFAAGRHKVNFNAANLPSGMYMYVLDAGGRRLSRTLIVLK